jgi:hypothetical protein
MAGLRQQSNWQLPLQPGEAGVTFVQNDVLAQDEVRA